MSVRTIAAIVPIYHDANGVKTARTDRAELLRRCVESLVAAADHARADGTGFCEITIVVVDDYSPSDPKALLAPELLQRTRWLRNTNGKGQAGALNCATDAIDADVFAFTDSDCVVAVDWFVRLEEHYRLHPDHAGVAGPNWLFGRPRRWWSRVLTSQERRLMRFLAESEIDARHGTTTRIDCRNLSLRAEFAVRMRASGVLFVEDGSLSVSGQASHFLKSHIEDGQSRIGFNAAVRTFHEPVLELTTQLALYYARGRWSRFDEIYAAAHGSLRAAFLRQYAMRHFVSPLWPGLVSPGYLWPVHLAYWLGIARRRAVRH